jgi:hypothetical protein
MNYKDYTVCWMCTLSTKSVVAELFLDEEHA